MKQVAHQVAKLLRNHSRSSTAPDAVPDPEIWLSAKPSISVMEFDTAVDSAAAAGFGGR